MNHQPSSEGNSPQYTQDLSHLLEKYTNAYNNKKTNNKFSDFVSSIDWNSLIAGFVLFLIFVFSQIIYALSFDAFNSLPDEGNNLKTISSVIVYWSFAWLPIYLLMMGLAVLKSPKNTRTQRLAKQQKYPSRFKLMILKFMRNISSNKLSTFLSGTNKSIKTFLSIIWIVMFTFPIAYCFAFGALTAQESLEIYSNSTLGPINVSVFSHLNDLSAFFGVGGLVYIGYAMFSQYKSKGFYNGIFLGLITFVIISLVFLYAGIYPSKEDAYVAVGASGAAVIFFTLWILAIKRYRWEPFWAMNFLFIVLIFMLAVVGYVSWFILSGALALVTLILLIVFLIVILGSSTTVVVIVY